MRAIQIGVLCLLIQASVTCFAAGRPSALAQATNPVVDLALIYDGGPNRPAWTQERFRPYVCREKDGEFLFDGFLFIDFLAKSGARLSPVMKRRPDANKQDWTELLDHYFQETQSIGALDGLLGSLQKAGRVPARKRQVVISLPTPICGSAPEEISVPRPWGELDGRQMDFTQRADRLEAAEWYVDQTLRRWKQKQFKNLEFAGFYWVFERAWGVHHTADVAKYIRSKGSRLYWIPSWPQGRKNWSEYGFDFVYQQPNYFFHRQPTESDRLEKACLFAANCGTTMEMEFNHDLLKKPEFLRYFDEYVAAYDKHGVWDKKPVAYYEGGGAWKEMSESKDPGVRRRFEAMSDLIVRRQRKADHGFVFCQGAQ